MGGARCSGWDLHLTARKNGKGFIFNPGWSLCVEMLWVCTVYSPHGSVVSFQVLRLPLSVQRRAAQFNWRLYIVRIVWMWAWMFVCLHSPIWFATDRKALNGFFCQTPMVTLLSTSHLLVHLSSYSSWLLVNSEGQGWASMSLHSPFMFSNKTLTSVLYLLLCWCQCQLV